MDYRIAQIKLAYIISDTWVGMAESFRSIKKRLYEETQG